MIKCKPLCFQEQSAFSDGTGPVSYTISVGGMTEMFICCFDPDTNALLISNISGTSPTLSFKVKTIEEASVLVKSFADGMKIDLKRTIFTYHTHEK